AGDRISPAVVENLAGNFHEMLLVVGPAQTAGELQIVGELVIRLAKAGIGTEGVGVDASEIVVTLPIKPGRQRRWVCVGAVEHAEGRADWGQYLRLRPPLTGGVRRVCK